MIYNCNSVEIESVHIEFNKANSETTDLCVYVYSLSKNTNPKNSTCMKLYDGVWMNMKVYGCI